MINRFIGLILIILIDFNNIIIAQNGASKLKIDYKIINSINNTWGYDILIGNKLKIHQPTIPCLNGVEGFKTKNSAIKTAKLVIKKMKEGLMPPTITIEELKKLKVI